jgi:hypothetical protein
MTIRRSCVVLAFLAAIPVAAQQTFSGRLSDSTCGMSHRAAADPRGLSDRQCLVACINKLAKYVLVDQNNRVVQIANQDAMGLPLYAGRPVKIAGELKDGALLVSKVEAIPAHLHIGHVMTNWRDTPGTRGFLPVAIDEARVAVLHARQAAAATALDEITLHARHVLNALDPALEPKGPGAGYGVKKAAAGALQHLELATTAEGATPNITTLAADATASLRDALTLVDQAIADAQRVAALTDASAAAAAAAELLTLTQRLGEQTLQHAQSQMTAMLKAEGLLGAPRYENFGGGVACSI